MPEDQCAFSLSHMVGSAIGYPGFDCPREPWEGTRYCVLHARSEDKMADEVVEALGDEHRSDGAYLPVAFEAGEDVFGLEPASLAFAEFPGAKLVEAQFSDVFLYKASFPDAELKLAEFSDADLMDALFPEADLTGAKFSEADLKGADFSKADLRFSKFSETDIKYVEFPEANLIDASFIRSDLSGANLQETKLDQATFRFTSINPGTDFGDHHQADEEWEAAERSYRKVRQLAQENSLPELQSEMHLAAKDAWRKQQRDVFLDEVQGLSRSSPLFGAIKAPGKAWEKVKETSKKGIRWLYTEANKRVTGYGEKPWHVVKISAAILLISATLYPVLGIDPGPNSAIITYVWPPDLWAWLSAFGNGIYFSAVTFSTVGYGDLQPAGSGAKTLATIETILGAFLMALLVYVLGRRATR